MKKTFRFLSMAALLVVGAIMTGCSNDNNIDNPQQPANKYNVVTLTATVSIDGGAETRAITPSTGAKTFEATNKIAVFYKDESGNIQKAVSGDLTLSAEDTKATFTVTLTNPATGGKVRYIYPASMAKDLDATPLAYPEDATIDDATIDYTGLLGSQNGNLTNLGTNYDLAVFDGLLSGTDLPASASMLNPLAICALTLKDGGNDITNSVNSLSVSDGTNTYHVTPSSQSPIYVAMKPVALQKIAFTAATGSKTYFKTTASAQTLAASTIYNSITVSMTELAVGNVFCSDGSVYESADAAKTDGNTPVAKIVYLGNDAETSTTFKHGLALALKDVGTYAWCSGYGGTWLCSDHQYSKRDDAKADMAGIANTDYLIDHAPDGHDHYAAKAARNYSATCPAGTSAWFLPSAGQWDKMVGTGGYGLTDLKKDESDYKGLSLSDDSGYGYYWSSSENEGDDAWRFLASDGRFVDGYKHYTRFVRSCLAF